MADAEQKKQPSLYPEYEPYWAAAANGALMLRHCTQCDKFHHYPRNICPHCRSTALDWRASEGLGRVYAFSGLAGRRGAEAPAVVAYVTLAEGPTVSANLVDMTLDDAEIGRAVKARFVPRENSPFPALVFGPAAQS